MLCNNRYFVCLYPLHRSSIQPRFTVSSSSCNPPALLLPPSVFTPYVAQLRKSARSVRCGVNVVFRSYWIISSSFCLFLIFIGVFFGCHLFLFCRPCVTPDSLRSFLFPFTFLQSFTSTSFPRSKLYCRYYVPNFDLESVHVVKQRRRHLLHCTFPFPPQSTHIYHVPYATNPNPIVRFPGEYDSAFW